MAQAAAALAAWNNGTGVWIADTDQGYIDGWVVNVEGDISTVATNSGPVRQIPTVDLLKVNPPNYDGTSDIADLPHLNEASVVHNLRTRYLENSIYTYSGLFLVAVNPYRSLPIYTTSVIESYKNKRRDENVPHVFAVAERAWQNMMTHRDQSQSILVTGESGAGKTENTKKVIQYLAAIAADPLPASPSIELLVARTVLRDQQSGSTSVTGKQLGALERQILQANPILEAFGNAQTVKNNNSSRFGKFVRIYFNSIGAIAGANIDWYLLEKSRVTARSEHERSFHIFFQLLRGADAALKSTLLLKGKPQDYDYLNKSRLEVDGMDDREEWNSLITALNTVGFTPEEQVNLFKIISAILHLGNIQVDGTSQAHIKDLPQLEKVGFLLGLDDRELRDALVRPTIKVGTELVVQARSKRQVVDEIAALSKALYEKNMGAIVERINKALGRPSTKTFIGVLDIAGFEIFDVNGFEQLCINLTNEKLQQFFNHHMFVLEQEEYAREDIGWRSGNFGAELQPTIDLIESNSPMGILSCLNDACILSTATDSTFTNKMHQLAAAQPVSTQYTKYSASRLSLGFTVSHYAAEVEYRTDGWLDKNRDPLNDTLTSLLANSTNPYTARLFAEYLEPDTIVDKPRIRKGAFRTVGQRHKEQLAFLMTQLSQTQPHFIRCIVPNLTKSPGIIDTPLVLNQLKCNGVLEGVRISRLGYPNRLPFLEFRRRFELLTPGMVPKGFVDGRTACEIMLRGLELEKESFKLGLSKVFFKAGILARLEERRDEYLSDIFTRIQATSRGFVARRLANKVLNRAAAVRTIQRNARLYIELKNWPWWPLFQRVRPLLAAARSDDEMRRKEAELNARREQAEKEVIERKRLELIQSDLESQRDKMIADLDNERLRSSEYEILWIQAKENQVASEEELSSIQTRLNSMNERVAQILVTKSLDDTRLIDLTTTLSISDKALATLRSEQIEWKKKEAALKESTSVKTVEWNSMVASKEKSRLRIKELESNLNDVEEDRKRGSTRLSKSIEAAQTKLVATTSELSKLTTRLAMIETEARLSKDEVVALIKDKKEKEGIIKSKESEVNRVTREQERLLKERDLATKSASDLQIQLASLTKQLTDQSRSLKSAEDSLSRSVDDNTSMKKLLDDKVSDQQRQAETNRIAEDKLQDLRARLARVSEELVDTQSHSRSESEKSKLALDTAVREVIESKRKNDELTRTSSALSAQLSRAQEETKDLSHDLAEVESRAELMRKKWAEATLKEREMFDKELAVMTDKVQLFEDAILRAGRDKLTGLAKIERLEKSLEGERERGVGLEQMVKRMEETNEQQLGTLVDLDQINGNLRAELGTTQTRLRSAEDKVGKTVVEHIRVLEEAQRLQNQELERMRIERIEQSAQIRTLERAKESLNRNLEDVQQARDAERLARLNINRPQQMNGQSRAEAAYESEKKLRQLAELNVTRLTSEIQAQQSKLEASAREAAELRRSKTLMERELNTIAASDVPPTGTTGYEGRLANLTPSSPTKGPIRPTGTASRRGNYE